MKKLLLLIAMLATCGCGSIVRDSQSAQKETHDTPYLKCWSGGVLIWEGDVIEYHPDYSKTPEKDIPYSAYSPYQVISFIDPTNGKEISVHGDCVYWRGK